MSESASLSRRGFVATCACLAMSGMAASCASLAARPVPFTGGVVRLTLSEFPELAKPGGATRVVPEGTDELVYVLALGDGEYVALSPICTHRGCTVNIEGPRLVCPCHGSTYDRRGNVLRGPAERALGRHELTPMGAELIIRLSRA